MSDRKKEQAVERALTEGYEKYYRLAYSLYIMKRTRWILYRKQPIKLF